MNINCKQKFVRNRFVLPVILLCWFALSTCGPYSFSGSSVPSHIKTIAVPLFEDQTTEFGIKEKLTDAIIEEITRDNSMKIANESMANAIVYGKIISVTDQAYDYNADEQVQSYRVNVTVEVEVRDVKKAAPMWKEQWRQWGEYVIDPGTDARQEGIQAAIKKIAEDVLNKTVSGW